MVIEGLDPIVLSKLIRHQIEQVTCIECCKYFIAPETAVCGHSLCHSCWKGRRTCHTCAAPVERKTLRLNIPLQSITEHIHALADSFQKTFNVKLDELTLNLPEENQSNDPTKHVKEWLASSENHFSGPVSSQASALDVIPAVEFSKSKVLVHTHKKKTQSPVKVVHKPPPQQNWDKIEILPDSEDICERPRDHAVEPMEIEPFLVDETEYTTNNPRRSSRKKDLKSDSNEPLGDVSVEKNSGKITSIDSDKKTVKSKQTWSNVKKMKKEFGKLNKKNKSKLNVSIEMVKKAQSSLKQQKLNTQPETPLVPKVVSEPTIDDSTPIVTNHSKECGSRNNSVTYDKENTSLNMNKTNSKDGSTELVLKQKESTDSSKSNFQSKISSTENHNDQNNKPVNSSQNNDNIKSASQQSNDDVSVNKAIKINSMPFIRKSTLCRKSTLVDNCVQVTQKENDPDIMTTSTDDIEISIKIKNTITNIVIKNKGNDVQMKVGTDREIQTSLGPNTLPKTTDVACSPIHIQNVEIVVGDGNKVAVAKTATKINTASVETATATATPHFDISDSVEKELSDVMECLERNRAKSVHKTPLLTKSTKHTQQSPLTVKETTKNTSEPIQINISEHVVSEPAIEPASSSQPVLQPPSQNAENKDANEFNKNKNEDVEDLNDIDIFNSGSVKEACVKLLKDSKNAHSEIIMPTVKSKKSQKVVEKRDRETDNEELPCSKKLKTHSQETKEVNQDKIEKPVETENDSEPMNYDAIMSQVFANIDAEIQSGKSKNNDVTKQNNKNKNLNSLTQVKHTSNKVLSELDHNQIELSQIIHKTQSRQVNKEIPVEVPENTLVKEITNQKFSENVFSMIEKDSESPATSEKVATKLQEAQSCTQQQIDNLLTPGMCRDIVSSANNSQTDKDIVMMETDIGTPIADHDDSDGVVEETPQKSLSFVKPRQTVTNVQPLQRQKTNETVDRETVSDSQIIKSIINISDTTLESGKDKDITVVTKRKETETPLTINKFVNHIKHNSTPVARKSLHFEDHSEDPEQTLCPTSTQEKDIMCPTSTQEKEIIAKAFEPTPKSPVTRPLGLRNVQEKKNIQFFIAGTCLTSAEVKNIKLLCQERGWTYLDKYTNDLTHLVVGVDEENKSQRSVKYMCALAASKWIVNYAWVQKCLQLKTVVDELPYEALDACGEPGPKRSRTAARKLFEGFTFYCMPPFSVLDMGTLKEMLQAAGAIIAQDPSGVKVTADSGVMPALLLAEPEHTQEDRFVYFAIEHSIVPVNYEWALNCLGTYSLGSILDLLLCPVALLPPGTQNWPAVLMQEEEEEENYSVS